MDRYEYKVRIAQIKSLIENGEFYEALQIVNTIDWRRVRSIQTLCMVSEIYKVNRKYDEARDVLLLAYNRYPGARSVVYALCELAIKTERITEAVHYLKEFTQIANGDSGMYVLQYKLYQSQGVGIEERIEVLKKLKSLDYQERWAYELAKMYHEIGQESQCIAECDEMIVWFGHGSFVNKAMELKMLHAPLTPEQQKKYDHRNDWKRGGAVLLEEREDELREEETYPEEKPAEEPVAEVQEAPKDEIPIEIKRVEASNQPTKKIPQKEIEAQLRAEDIKIHPVNLDKFSTMNLQAELKKNMAEFSAKTGFQLREVEQPIESIKFVPKREPIMAMPAPEEMEEITEEDVAEISSETPVTEEPQAETENIVLMREDPVQETAEEPVQEVAEEQESDDDFGADADYVSDETGRIDLEGILEDWNRRAEAHGKNRIARAKRKSLEQTNDIVNDLAEVIPGFRTAPIPEIPDEEIMTESGMEELTVEDTEAEETESAEAQTEEITAEENVSEESALEAVEAIGSEEEISEETASEDAEQSETESEEDETEDSVAETETDIEAETEETAENDDEDAEAHEAAIAGVIAEAAEAVTEKTESALDTADTEGDDTDAEQSSMRHETLEETTDLSGILTGELPVTTGGAFVSRRFVETADDIEDDDIPPMPETDKTAEAAAMEDDDDDEDYVPRKPHITPDIRVGHSRKYIAPSAREAEGFDEEEKEIFSEFLTTHDLPEDIRGTIDGMNMQGNTGNVVITGNVQSVRLKLAQALAKYWEAKSASFDGKIACIDANKFNTKSVSKSLDALHGGILVIAHAGDLENSTLLDMKKYLENKDSRAIVILEENNIAASRMQKNYGWFVEIFSQTIEVPTYTNDDLVFHGREYARGKEYTIDDMGVLALYTRIDEMQTADHFVTVDEVEEIVDQAIRHADRRTPQHFLDLIVGKRYDDNDLIVLREKDFVK